MSTPPDSSRGISSPDARDRPQAGSDGLATAPASAAAGGSDGAARAAAPLTPEELARADRVARRLHSELGAFLNAFPPSVRHASALARQLGVDRTLCQRAVFLATRPYPGPDLFARLPGVRGLHMLAEAASACRPPIDRAIVDALVTAIVQYQELVAALGGSVTRLARRIERGRASPALAGRTAVAAGYDASDPHVRLFDAAAALTGRSSECWVAVYVYRVSPADPGVIEVYRANGLVGHVAAADAVPLVVHNFSGSKKGDPVPAAPFTSLENAPAIGRSPTVVLDDFTTQPPPLVTARQPDSFLVQSIDERAPAGRPVDLMLATRTTIPHPARQQPSLDEVWAMVNFPARHLLLDVWLHRDVARACEPSLDTHLWGPDFADRVGERWQTRFADSPPLQLLGSGLPRRAPPAYPRLGELTAQLFARAGLDPDAYVGYRCDVAYPLWRTGYCMRFDYAAPPGDEEHDGAPGT